MAITELYSDSGTTIGGTEYSLPNDSTTLTPITTDVAGMQAFIDFSNMAAGDQYEVKVYEKVYSGGTQRLVFPVATLTGAQSEIFVTPGVTLLHGWDVTVKKLAGTDRSISWSIRGVT